MCVRRDHAIIGIIQYGAKCVEVFRQYELIESNLYVNVTLDCTFKIKIRYVAVNTLSLMKNPAKYPKFIFSQNSK